MSEKLEYIKGRRWVIELTQISSGKSWHPRFGTKKAANNFRGRKDRLAGWTATRHDTKPKDDGK